MRCAVVGGTGYIGVRLVSRLLAEGHDVAVLVRSPHKLATTGWAHRVDVVPGDLADPVAVAALVAGADAVVHLAHALDRPDFPARDRAAAHAVGEAAAAAGVRRIVYLGGLRPTGEPASRHLASRAEVADVFLAGAVPTAALEASIVIGSGSASFELIRYLAERVPVLPAVPWLAHRTQPIAVADVLHLLVGALDLPADVDRRFAIGGPDVLT
ncbi:MAG TPA: NAD(P)H-binding protein, partial [Actinomycetospora sp.]|nr:NAD(P)H-binding protein [Actinomycetospora sp.]